MNRYLVLIHLAAKTDTATPAQRAISLHSAMNALLDEMETVLTSDKGFAFACVSPKSSADLWKSVTGAFKHWPQDNITVLEVGSDITSTHRGVQNWQAKTGVLAGLAELARQK